MNLIDERPVGVVILGSDFQALGAIRSFAENNIPVFLMQHEFGISMFSRYVKRRDDYLLLSPEEFSDRMIEIAKKENLKGWMLFPNDDEVVKLVSIAREDLQKWYKIPVPSWENVQQFYYKNNASKIADELSIPVPQMYNSPNLDDLLSQDLVFPLVLKPTFKKDYFPVTKKKGIRVDTIEELKREYLTMCFIQQLLMTHYQ